MCITGYIPTDDNTSSTSHPVNLVTKTTPYLSSHYPHAYVSHYSIVPCPVSLFPITRTSADVQQQEKGVLPSAPQAFHGGLSCIMNAKTGSFVFLMRLPLCYTLLLHLLLIHTKIYLRWNRTEGVTGFRWVVG